MTLTGIVLTREEEESRKEMWVRRLMLLFYS